jgi:hypothetical protein
VTVLLLSPPDPKTLSPAGAFALFLEPRPRWSFEVELSGLGRVELFVPALSSRRWVEIHRRLGRDLAAKDPRAEAEYVASLVVDREGLPALSADAILGLYEHETARLAEAACEALAVVSPTYAACDVRAWSDYLHQGALDPANISDALSLGGCFNVSWGYGRGAVHVFDHPETWFGIPRRELLDCHQMIYGAARRARAEIMKG